MPSPRIIRHEIYDFIKSKGVELSQLDIGYLSSRLQHHNDERIATLRLTTKKHAKLENHLSLLRKKLAEYIAKSKTIKDSPRVSGQAEGLAMALKWLTEPVE